MEVYLRLAEFLDRLPAGFPATGSGVELRILRRLFAPEEAELVMHLALIPEEARVVARRAGIPVDEAAQRLEQLETKGLVFALHPPGKPPQYMAAHWVVGIYEYQLNKLTPELLRDIDEYAPHWWKSSAWQKAPQMRTIPVSESLSPQLEVMAYEQADQLVRSQKTFAVAPCICRQAKHLAGDGCGLCVSTCPGEAMSLVRKPAGEQSYVPKDITETNIKLGQARGVLGTPDLIGMMVRSKMDRLLAPR